MIVCVFVCACARNYDLVGVNVLPKNKTTTTATTSKNQQPKPKNYKRTEIYKKQKARYINLETNAKKENRIQSWNSAFPRISPVKITIGFVCFAVWILVFWYVFVLFNACALGAFHENAILIFKNGTRILMCEYIS